MDANRSEQSPRLRSTAKILDPYTPTALARDDQAVCDAFVGVTGLGGGHIAFGNFR